MTTAKGMPKTMQATKTDKGGRVSGEARAFRKASLLVGLCVMASVILASVSPAFALQRTNTFNFGLDGTSGGTFTNEPTSAAFDQTNKKFFANHVLVGMVGWSVPTPGTYTPLTSPWPLSPGPGTAAATRGIAIDNTGGATNGRIYQVQESGVQAYNSNGTAVGAPFPTTIPTPRTTCGDAVDSSGNVFVANANATAVAEGRGIYRYTSAGTALPTINTSAFPGLPCRLAFDSSNNLYVATSAATGQVWKYTAASSYTSATLFDSFAANGVAVDKATGHVFVAHPERITEYDTSGTLLGEFGNEVGSSSTKRYLGVAVNEATNEVYVTDSNTTAAQRKIKVFGPPVIVKPEAITNPATAVARNEATLNGEVDPAGGTGITECKFQWGPTTAYANSAACVPAASVGSPIISATGVSAVIPSASLTPGTLYHFRMLAKNSEGTTVGADRTFTTIPAVKETVTGAATSITQNSATLNGSFNADSIATTYYFEYGPTTSYGTKVPLPAPPGANGGNAAASTPVSQNITGLEPSTSPTGKTYNYRIVAVNSFGSTLGENKTFNTLPAVKALATQAASNITAHAVTLNGTFDPNGVATKYYFEYGTTVAYGSYAPVGLPGENGGETIGSKSVSAVISGLETGVTYNFRLVATNSFGMTQGANLTVVPNQQPTVTSDVATQVNTDGATLRAVINPNALATTYHFEYGPEDCSISTCEIGPTFSLAAGKADVPVSLAVVGLVPDTVNHFRILATNSRGTTTGVDHAFKTFPIESGIETCPNALVRKQTGAGVAPRCRAYELVSAADTGGYDVESNLIPGLTPLEGYPRAEGKVLYTVHFGAIPGSGDPTNRGGDPYVATRGENGWSTEYVGLQADSTPSLLPFSSTLGGADEGLNTFAFAGSEVCNPCFEDGSTNVPLRLPDGSLVEGMAGSLNPGPANPAGQINKRFSGNGNHFIFGSTAKFEPAGNNGELSIYDRNLQGGTTQVVSTMPNGSTMTGTGIAELDVSRDGSRILIGKLVSTDTKGNQYWHLYMHVGNSASSIDLTPGTTSGVLYAGMDEAGTKVYFTTPDKLLVADTDESPDLYRADVGSSSASLALVSTGTEGTGNSNACDPASNADGNNWNAVGVASTNNCGVVAIAGGGGVAAEAGTVFFLSPEKLDGSSHGTLNQPNLYIDESGSAPHYVTTVGAGNPAVRHAVSALGMRNTADFQVTPDGQYSVFSTDVALTGASTAGHVEVYRYDASAGGSIACVSCAPTNGAPATDTRLTSGGLNLTDDGRVLFTSSEQLVLRDTNQLKDVYEWDNNSIGLISTGLDTNDSGLLTASANGRDVFFFTRQTLAPQDENGGAMKIYDAREDGGFLYNPPPHPCVASDECHGAGSKAPAAPSINTVEGTGEPQPVIPGAKRCKPGFMTRHASCVRRPRKRHHRHSTRRHG
jgi:hypothetical protein